MAAVAAIADPSAAALQFENHESTAAMFLFILAGREDQKRKLFGADLL